MAGDRSQVQQIDHPKRNNVKLQSAPEGCIKPYSMCLNWLQQHRAASQAKPALATWPRNSGTDMAEKLRPRHNCQGEDDVHG